MPVHLDNANPVKLLLTEGRAHPDQTVGDVLVRLRRGCGSRTHKDDLVAHLCEDVYGPTDNLPVKAGWSILLHDGVGEPSVPIDPEGAI